jgi:hypothetical protein
LQAPIDDSEGQKREMENMKQEEKVESKEGSRERKRASIRRMKGEEYEERAGERREQKECMGGK